MRELLRRLSSSTALRIAAALALVLVLLALWAWRSRVATSGVIRGDVLVSAKPARVHLVASDTAQHLNFDFVLTNRSDKTLVLNKIELSVFDAAGKLARREFFDEHGRKSLELTPSPVLDEGQSMLVYNPFHTFGPEVPLDKLQYEFSFRTEDRGTELQSRIVVSPVAYESKTDLILPVRGRVLVWDGHDHHSHHRRRDYLPFVESGYGTNHSRYSYDLVIVDERGSLYKGRPRANDDWYSARPDNWDDYYSFGAPVYATGAGRITHVRDIKPDDRKFDEQEFATDENSPAGNYIVIDHLNGEFSVFGHIRQGSSRVRVGQMVQQGERIAAMGASGTSLFPHLHYELRTGPGVKNVEGLPSYFSNFRRIVGSRSIDVKRGVINTGDLVDWQSSTASNPAASQP
jgi:hypothetical protein